MTLEWRSMSRYTLKTYWGATLLEQFDHRSVVKLKSILIHPRHNRAGQLDPWDRDEQHPTRFEIFDSHREKLFDGGITDALNFVSNIK